MYTPQCVDIRFTMRRLVGKLRGLVASSCPYTGLVNGSDYNTEKHVRKPSLQGQQQLSNVVQRTGNLLIVPMDERLHAMLAVQSNGTYRSHGKRTHKPPASLPVTGSSAASEVVAVAASTVGVAGL